MPAATTRYFYRRVVLVGWKSQQKAYNDNYVHTPNYSKANAECIDKRTEVLTFLGDREMKIKGKSTTQTITGKPHSFLQDRIVKTNRRKGKIILPSVDQTPIPRGGSSSQARRRLHLKLSLVPRVTDSTEVSLFHHINWALLLSFWKSQSYPINVELLSIKIGDLFSLKWQSCPIKT